ncbi:MAG TPA: phosphatase PAP2 family protein [Bryocella sp.]|nr:phosphatase PAP2 family protein [Bryocella sp.]
MRRFHVVTACALLALVLGTVVVSKVAGVQVQHPASLVVAIVVVMLIALPLPVYWHENRRPEKREAALMILWAAAFAVVLPLAVTAVARLGGPLRDGLFMRIDGAMGVSTPAIARWAAHHMIGKIINSSYGLLLPFLPLAILASGLSGRWFQARVYVVSNVAAFAIGLPLFGALPAIGPWHGYKTPPSIAQAKCETSLLTIRAKGSAPEIAGVVCFPSFHAIWAVLCGYAFSGFRRSIRIPVYILTTLMLLSTVTTGWHYVTDVLAGLLVAIVSLLIGRRIAMIGAPTGESSCF